MPGRTRVAGRQFLGLGGEGRADAPKNSAGEFLGDPPCEPQGLNSVFDTDKSTLAIIAQPTKNWRLYELTGRGGIS